MSGHKLLQSHLLRNFHYRIGFSLVLMWLMPRYYLVAVCPVSFFWLKFQSILILAIHCNRRRETLSMPKYSLKGHLQTECFAVVHFTEIICCNREITNVLIVFENRIVSSQPKTIAGWDTLRKRNVDTILLSNTESDFCITANGFRWGSLPQCTLVEGASLK